MERYSLGHRDMGWLFPQLPLNRQATSSLLNSWLCQSCWWRVRVVSLEGSRWYWQRHVCKAFHTEEVGVSRMVRQLQIEVAVVL